MEEFMKQNCWTQEGLGNDEMVMYFMFLVKLFAIFLQKIGCFVWKEDCNMWYFLLLENLCTEFKKMAQTQIYKLLECIATQMSVSMHILLNICHAMYGLCVFL